MRPFVHLCCAMFMLTSAAMAQTPQAPRSPQPLSGMRPAVGSLENTKPVTPTKAEAQTAPNFTLVKFDPRATAVRMIDGRWQLWSGKELLKDFGSQHAHALEARKLVAELQLTELGRLGAPQPVMEFWLSNGQAPPMTSASRTVIPFDPNSLKTEVVNGAHWIRDRTKLLYNFGPHRADAQQGLQVLQHFGFNEIAYVGAPNPTMSYLVKNDQPRLAFGKYDPVTLRTLPQTLPRYPLQILRLGTVGERIPFDALKLEMRRAPDGWHLASGVRDLGSLGTSENSARTALQIVQSYPFTELVRLGSGSPTFFLSRGAAPRGVPLGVRRTTFNPQSLTVKATGTGQQITDGNRVLMELAVPADEAKLAAKVLQHYQFDCLCEVGQLRYFAKER